MDSFGFSPVRLVSAFILNRNLSNRRKYRKGYQGKCQVIKSKKPVLLILEYNLSKPAQQAEAEEETSNKST